MAAGSNVWADDQEGAHDYAQDWREYGDKWRGHDNGHGKNIKFRFDHNFYEGGDRFDHNCVEVSAICQQDSPQNFNYSPEFSIDIDVLRFGRGNQGQGQGNQGQGQGNQGQGQGQGNQGQGQGNQGQGQGNQGQGQGNQGQGQGNQGMGQG
ncbi:hypothetical protein [Streptomyces sp. 8N616]|uniref:hypothetical protein n=1 Tax=Streptomyces sp. 8N616 TaxID=3457414 RepID=UPI003FD66FF9